MSLTESFLHDGTPCVSPDAFASHLTSRYESWCWVVLLPRQWHLDRAVNAVTAPCIHLLLAARDTTQSPAPSATGTEPSWQLLFVSLQAAGTNNRATQALVRQVLAGVPAGLRPDSFSLLVALNGDTHDRLGLYSAAAAQELAALLAESTAPLPFAAGVLQDGVLRWSGAHTRSSSSSDATESRQQPQWLMTNSPAHENSGAATATAAFVEVLRAADRWVRASSGLDGLADASLPAQGHNSALLSLLLPQRAGGGDGSAGQALQPLLWTSRYCEPATAARLAAGPPPDPSTLSGYARLRAERDAGREAWRANIGECVAFPLSAPADTSSSSGNSSSTGSEFSNVFLLQRPFRAKRAIDMDNRDPGPLAPQPVGAELHLLPDVGDAKHVEDQLTNHTGAMDFSYDDNLPAEGELLVQLGPVEGVPFDDIDRYLAFLNAHDALPTGTPARPGAREETTDAAGGRLGLMARPVLCVGSCSGYVYPRVVVRRPTGRTEKLNVITRARAEIQESSPSPADLDAAAQALRVCSAHCVSLRAHYPGLLNDPRVSGLTEADAWRGAARVPTEKMGYTLLNLPRLPTERLGPPSRRCAWCQRRRERLLRCGGCKAAWYCSRAHQALDWTTGTHKSECALRRQGQAWERQLLAPAVTALTLEERQRRTPGWSCGHILAAFLRDHSVWQVDGACTGPPAAAAAAHSRSAGNAHGSCHVHLVGVERGWLRDLVSALADCLRDGATHRDSSAALRGPQSLPSSSSSAAASAPPPQLRVSVAVESNDASTPPLGEEWANNAVVAIGTRDRDGGVEAVPATGVPGDIWHEQTAPSSAPLLPPLALVRVCVNSYFRFSETASGAAEMPDSGAAEAARAVLFVGPLSGDGLTYLNGSLELVARRAVGRVPVRFVDSSFIGAVRTANALVARLDARTDAAGTLARRRVAAGVDRVRKETAGSNDRAGEHGALQLNVPWFAASMGDTAESPRTDRSATTDGLSDVKALEECIGSCSNTFCLDIPAA